MENFKISVNSEAESKEAQGLFVVLGYMVVNNIDCEKGYIVASKNAESPINFDYWHDVKNIITIQQLRDLVVLKRNDVGDATHKDKFGLEFRKLNDIWYFFKDDKWCVSEQNWHHHNKLLKPITKEDCMKEYLEPTQANFLVKTDEGYIVQVLDENTVAADCYLIPDGAKCATTCLDDGELFTLFWKGECKICVGYDEEWFNIKRDIDDYLKDNPDANIVWQREPIDKNEQVLKEILGGGFEGSDAFIESNVEQGLRHPHYKKDVSNLEIVDIYRLTELFKPHSCGAHIAKKALCSGNRGHKDLLTDIQDIIDTAERWKEMLIEDENSCKD